MSKLWGGRFSGETDPHFESFNSSFRFDRRLLDADLIGSTAQTRALERAGVIDAKESSAIIAGLEQLRDLARDPSYTTRAEYSETEDVHSFIEARLVEIAGPVAYKIHTGRSRNDQVATATRIFLRDEIDRTDELFKGLESSLLDKAEQHASDPIPGYTHLQKAQPVIFGHYLLAYFEMFERDRDRFREARKRTNVCPLGSGAVAGTAFQIDREWLAGELGFEGVTHNSLDAVSDRDYIIDFMHGAAQAMMHLSRMAEDLIIYSSQEFGFIKLSDAIATGSSLMPQKKNPDSLELIRGKSARVLGHLTGTLALVKGLPLAYNKDLQEDKEALFDTIDTLSASLRVMTTVLGNIELNVERARRAAATDFTGATDLADYLVRQGVQFRQAHELVGRIVMYAIEQTKQLEELSLEEFRKFSEKISQDVYTSLTLDSVLASKDRTGGTSPARVTEELKRARSIINLQQDENYIAGSTEQ